MAVPAERYEELQTVDYGLVSDAQVATVGLVRAHHLELIQDLGQDTTASDVEIDDSNHSDTSEINSLGLYLNQIGKFKLLKPYEQIQLARAITAGEEAGRSLTELIDSDENWMEANELPDLRARIEAGRQAKENMINSNLRLVVWVAKGFQGNGLPLLDLIQEGTLGLTRAVEKFDPDLGFRFSTYARWWIRQSLQKAIPKQGPNIGIPADVASLKLKLGRAQQVLMHQLQREPTVEELAGKIGMSVRQIEELANLPITDSLNWVIKDGTELGDKLADPYANDPAEKAMESIQRENLREMVRSLPERQKQVILLRFGFGCKPHSLDAVSKKLGLSYQSVKQLENEALDKLEEINGIQPKDGENGNERQHIPDWPEVPKDFIIPEAIESSPDIKGTPLAAKRFVAYCLGRGITSNEHIAREAQRSPHTIRPTKYIIYRDLKVTRSGGVSQLERACEIIRRLQPEPVEI